MYFCRADYTNIIYKIIYISKVIISMIRNKTFLDSVTPKSVACVTEQLRDDEVHFQ